MSKRKEEALRIVESIVNDRPTAEAVLERLQEENFLHLGYGDRDVDLIVDTFTELFGTTKTTKHDRFAAGRLARSEGYGFAEGVVGLMKLYRQYADQQYAPSAASVAEFEDKLPKIVMFLRKTGQQQQSNQEIQL